MTEALEEESAVPSTGVGVTTISSPSSTNNTGKTMTFNPTAVSLAMSTAGGEGGGSGGGVLLDGTTTEQLESDLSLFLSNPKLTQQLAEGSLDLLGYSSVIEDELHQLESECIKIYQQKAPDIYKLKEEIETCDNVLTSLQEMLFGFQADLGGLSSDIRLLQEQSHTLEVQLRNRKRAELLLRSFLEQIVIPPNVAQVICHKDVNPIFMQCVETLNEKYANVCSTVEMLDHVNRQEQRRLLVGDDDDDNNDQNNDENNNNNNNKSNSRKKKEEEAPLFGPDDTTILNFDTLAKVLPLPCNTQAGREMKTHIQTLRLKAVQRIREYFLVKIGELRKPKTNVRMIQVNALLKYAPLNAFLYDIHQEQLMEASTSTSGMSIGGSGTTRGRFGMPSGSYHGGNSTVTTTTSAIGAGGGSSGSGPIPTDVYMEVKDAYVDSMSKTLQALFHTYHAQLLRLLEGTDGTGAAGATASYSYTSNVMAGRSHAGKQDLIAVEDASLRDMFSTKVNLSKKTDTFFLGGRVIVLDELMQHAPPILAHEALEEELQYPFERLFRSILTHLMDAALNEYVFCHGFFIHSAAAVNSSDKDGSGGGGTGGIAGGDDGQSSVAGSISGVSRASSSHAMNTVAGGGLYDKESLEYTFHSIFHKTLSIVVEQVENYLFHCYDCLAVLLMIKLTHASRRLMHIRHVYVMDPFFERLTQLLWPRLKIIMDAQLRSLRLATAAKLGGVELHAHYVSRRYAEFTSSVLLILNKGGGSSTTTQQQSSSSSPQQHGVSGGHLRKISNASDHSYNSNSAHGGGGGGGSGSGNTMKRMSRHSRHGGSSSNISEAATGGIVDNTSVHSSNSKTTTGVGGPSRMSSHSSTAGTRNYSSHSATRGGGGGGGSSSSVTGGGAGGLPPSSSSHHHHHHHQHQQQYSRGTAGDLLIHDLGLITQETIMLLERLSDELPNHKSRIVFLINNFDQIVQIFNERRVSPNSQEVMKFRDLLLQQRELFVEEELLSQGFSKMIAFVQQTESHMAQAQLAAGGGGGGFGGSTSGGGRGSSRYGSSSAAAATGAGDSINEAVVEALVRDFAAHWKRGIDTINRDVLSYFSNFRNGMEILKQVLTQLLLYYTRFQDIIRKHWRHKPPSWAKDLVSTSLILAEIKKYALNI